MAGARTLSLFSLADSADLDSQDHYSLSGSFRGGSATLRCSELALATPRYSHDLDTMRHSISTLSQAHFLHLRGPVRAVHFLKPSTPSKQQVPAPTQVLHLGLRPIPRKLLLDPRPC